MIVNFGDFSHFTKNGDYLGKKNNLFDYFMYNKMVPLKSNLPTFGVKLIFKS
jgi:hypothetical protein